MGQTGKGGFKDVEIRSFRRRFSGGSEPELVNAWAGCPKLSHFGPQVLRRSDSAPAIKAKT